MKKNSFEKIDIENEEEYIKWCKNLKVHLIKNQYLSLIDDHNREIENRKTQEKEKYKDRLPFYLQYRLNYKKYSEKKAVLNIDVSDKQRTRAYIFIDYFMKEVQALGASIRVDTYNNDNILIKFAYCTFGCSLTEKRCKYRDVKLAGLNTMRPLYDLVNTGKLIFKIYTIDENNKISHEFVYDEEKVELKEQIRDIFINLRASFIEVSQKNIEAERVRREEIQEKDRQWKIQWEKEKEEEERKKEYELIMEQKSIIENHMEKWEHIKNIKAYVEDMRIYADKQPDTIKEPIKQYCDYVEELFDKNIFFTDIIEFTKEFILKF